MGTGDQISKAHTEKKDLDSSVHSFLIVPYHFINLGSLLLGIFIARVNRF